VKHVRITRLLTTATLAVALAAPSGAFADVATETPLADLALPTAGSPLPVDPTVPATPAPVLVVTSYTTSADRITPGSAFDLTLTVYNATSRRADNVVVVLGATGAGGDTAAAAGLSGGLTVLETGNAKYIGSLKGQREDTVAFRVIAGPGTPPGTVNVPVTVSFEHAGARQEVAYTIGLLIEREAAISLVSAEVPESAIVGEPLEVSFEVANAGAFALSGASLSVEASGAVVTEGSIFLGSIDAATTEIIDATVTPESPGALEIAVILTYRDDFGREQTFRATRTVTVEDQPEIGPDEAPEEDGADDEEGNWFVRFFKALFGLGE